MTTKIRWNSDALNDMARLLRDADDLLTGALAPKIKSIAVNDCPACLPRRFAEMASALSESARAAGERANALGSALSKVNEIFDRNEKEIILSIENIFNNTDALSPSRRSLPSSFGKSVVVRELRLNGAIVPAWLEEIADDIF